MEPTLEDYLKQGQDTDKFCRYASEIPTCIQFINEEVKKLGIYDQSFQLFSPVESNRSEERIMSDINLLFRVMENSKRSVKQQEISDSEISKLRQNYQLKNQQLQEQLQLHEKEMRDVIAVVQSQQFKEKQLSQQVEQLTQNLTKQCSAYDALVRKFDINDKTVRRLTQENEELQHRLGQALRKESSSFSANPKTNIKIDVLETAIRDLYRDIYQQDLAKHANFDQGLATLAEAVVHVQKTYNDDMEQMGLSNEALTRRVAELENQVIKLSK